MTAKWIVKFIIVPFIAIIVMVASLTFASIPFPYGNVTISLAYPVLAVVSGVCGPITAAIVGLLALGIQTYPQLQEEWFALAIASGVLGFVYGQGIRHHSLHSGVFSKHDALRFNVVQVVANVGIFGLILPTLEVFLYQKSTSIVFIEGWISSMVYSVTIAIVATFLLKGFALIKMHSLEKTNR